MHIKGHFIMLWAISQMDLCYSLTLLTEVELKQPHPDSEESLIFHAIFKRTV